MRPAGGDRRSPQKVKDGQTDVRKNMVVPLSAEAEEFSLRTVPKTLVPTKKIEW